MHLRFSLLTCLILLMTGLWTSPQLSAASEEVINEHPLVVQSVELRPTRIAPGGNAEVIIKFELAPEYHAYLQRFHLALAKPQIYRLGKAKVSPVMQFYDTISKQMKDGAEGKATIQATIEAPTDMKKSRQDELEFELTYQACTKSHCLFPQTLTLHPTTRMAFILTDDDMPRLASASVVAHEETDSSSAKISEKPENLEKPEGTKNSEWIPTSLPQAMQRGIWAALLFAFMGGVLTSLTPCIYPMIPITLTIIGAGSRGHSKVQSFWASLIYVLGIATTYSIAGLMAASSGALFGSLLGHPLMVTALALLFTSMGLSMFGLFEVQLPYHLKDWIEKQTQNKNLNFSSRFGTTFFSGLIAGLVASPCVGPVLVTILAWIAQTGNRTLGMSLLFSFAMGMGVLFIVLGTFSNWINKLPRSGPWMEFIKFIFGSSMLILSVYYISAIAPMWLTQLLIALNLMLIAFSYSYTQYGTSLHKVKSWHSVLLIFCLLLSGFFIGRAYEQHLDAQAPTPSSITPSNALPWQPYTNDILQKAKQEKRPVVIDFYADWCAACHELEEITYPAEAVKKMWGQFVWLKVDATDSQSNPELYHLQAQYNVIGLPTVLFINSAGQLQSDLTLTGFESGEAFAARLQKVLQQTSTAAP